MCFYSTKAPARFQKVGLNLLFSDYENGRSSDNFRSNLIIVRNLRMIDKAVWTKKTSAVAASLASFWPAPPKKHKIRNYQYRGKIEKEIDKAINTTIWLAYDKVDRDHLASLKRSVCIRLADKIQSCRNFNPAFIEGLQNLRASFFKDNTATDMHKHAMILFHKSRSGDVVEYAPIARALSTLDQNAASKLKRKLEIANPFTKMSE